MAGGRLFGDFQAVAWGSTLKLALARGLFTGLIIAFLMAFQKSPISGMSGFDLVLLPFVWSLIAVPLAIGIHFAGNIFGAFIPLLGLWFRFIGALAVCLGDPLLYLFHRWFPDVLDHVDLKVMQFRPLIVVTP